MNLRRFKRLLAARGMSMGGLAAAIQGGRSHVSQVLHGKAGRGHFTRRKLARVLTKEELEALGWGAGARPPGEEAGKKKGRTILDLEWGHTQVPPDQMELD